MSQKIIKNQLVFFTQIYSKIATENVTKNSKKYIVFFSQLVSKIAIGNVTKYSKKSITDCKRATGIYFLKTSSTFCVFFLVKIVKLGQV